jgi:hypothetical protein
MAVVDEVGRNGRDKRQRGGGQLNGTKKVELDDR